ncbi:MAG: ABC transporter substrate-binding protein [Thermomicrobiales bacterium]
MSERKQGLEHETTPTVSPTPWSRRQFMRRAGAVSAGLAALPILAACSSSLATATSAPAAATKAPAANPTPAGTAVSGGAGSTTSSSSSAAASSASGSTTAAKTTSSSSAAAGAPTPVPPTATAVANIPRAKSNAKVTGKIRILQDNDFHPDHNAFLRSEIEAFCRAQNWDYVVTSVAGYQGTGDLNQLLVASVQAGNAADLLIKDHQTRQLQFLGTLEKTTDLYKEMAGQYGETHPGMVNSAFFDNDWWAVPFFTRAGGFYAREDVFKKNNMDVDKDTDTYEKLRDTLLKISDPDNKSWGWGMTVNRSGDGNSMVSQVLMRYGSQLQDKAGQVVTLNSKETIAGLQFLKETYSDSKWAKMLPPGVNSWTDTSNNEAFLAGQISFTDNAGTMYAKAQLDKVPFAKDITYLNRPKRVSDGVRLDNLGGTKFYVLKGTKNKDATYDLIRHLLTLPVQQRIWTISLGYACPAYEKGWDDPIIQNDKNAKRAKDVAYANKDFNGLAWPGPDTAATDAVGGGTYYTDMMADVLGGKAIDQVAADYTKKIVQVYKDFGFKGQ